MLYIYKRIDKEEDMYIYIFIYRVDMYRSLATNGGYDYLSILDLLEVYI